MVAMVFWRAAELEVQLELQRRRLRGAIVAAAQNGATQQKIADACKQFMPNADGVQREVKLSRQRISQILQEESRGS